MKEYVLLRLHQNNATQLYFEGRWWETLVANQVRNWSTQRENLPEVWRSVIFQTNEKDTHPKNEVDVLLNNQQKLIFIECNPAMSRKMTFTRSMQYGKHTEATYRKPYSPVTIQWKKFAG